MQIGVGNETPCHEGMCARCTRGAPGIQINVLAIHPNALPPNPTPSSSPGYVTPAVSGAHMWAEWLHHPCLLGGSPTRVRKWGKGGGGKGKTLPGAPGTETYSPE